MDRDILLRVSDLSVSFPSARGPIRAVRNVSFDIRRGEIVALVGEFGSGKSTTGLAMMRLLQAANVSGSICLTRKDGTASELLELGDRAIRKVRGNDVAMIFQEPMSSLDPVFTIGTQMREAVLAHQRILASRGARGRGGVPGGAGAARSREMHAQFPASALGRDAPAGDDRHVAREPPLAADRRRADDRSRRHDPGADRRSPKASAAADRHGDSVHHAQSRSRGGDRRPRHGDVCRRDRGDRRGRPALRQSAHALYARLASLAAAPGPQARAERPDRTDPGQPAEPGRAAAGLRLPSSLQPGGRGTVRYDAVGSRALRGYASGPLRAGGAMLHGRTDDGAGAPFARGPGPPQIVRRDARGLSAQGRRSQGRRRRLVHRPLA